MLKRKISPGERAVWSQRLAPPFLSMTYIGIWEGIGSRVDWIVEAMQVCFHMINHIKTVHGREGNTCLGRLLDISQACKILGKVVSANGYSFTLGLASLASRRDFLNLEKWIEVRTCIHGLY